MLFQREAINSPKRSLLKSITWRLIAELDTMLISYFLSGSIALSLSIVGIESVTKFGLYYLHERVWGHVTWRMN